MFTDTWHADGSGIYSWIAWEVEILDMCVDVCDEQDFGELRVYFNTKGVNGWDVEHFGLIYTDPGFLTSLRMFLIIQGFSLSDALDTSYSEQGMQGDEYVSFDVGALFVSAWEAMLGRLIGEVHDALLQKRGLNQEA